MTDARRLRLPCTTCIGAPSRVAFGSVARVTGAILVVPGADDPYSVAVCGGDNGLRFETGRIVVASLWESSE